MLTILLTAHTLIVVFLVIVILMQKSDGAGGLAGMGGGGGGGGFMTGRGVASALTRSTSVLAALFFASSLGLAMIANEGETFSDAATDLTGEEVFVPENGEINDTGDLLDVFDTDGTTSEPATPDSTTLDVTAPDILDDPLDALETDETDASEAEPKE